METIVRAGLSNAVAATVLALVVAGLTRPLARRPAVLHFLWLLVLLKLVTPPLYEVPLAWPAPLAGAREAPAADAVCRLVWADRSTATAATVPKTLDLNPLAIEAIVAEPERDPGLVVSSLGEAGPPPLGWSSIDWVRPVAVLWLGGAVGALIVACRRIRRFQHLLGTARPASPDDQEWVDGLASVLELRRTPSVWWVGGPLSPMIWPLGRRPRLIIPGDLWKTLDTRQRSTLVLHELAHLRRGDHWLRFFELFVTALYWWHPLVWLVRHALRDAEEACCDAWVVWAFPDSAKTYAETLLETLDFLNRCDLSEPLLASSFGKVDHLRRRLTMIMSGTTPRRLGAGGALGALALAAVLLPVGATWAQKPEKPQEVQVVVKSLEDLELTKEGDAVARIETKTGTAELPLIDLVASLDNDEDPERRITLRLKTDDSPEVVVSGPIDEAIAKLKKQLGEIAKKSPRSEQDEARMKALKQAVAELGKVAGQVKSIKPGERAEGKKVLALRHAEVNLNKPISPEQKAEIDEARVKVKKLTGELAAKQKELAEARGRLAKLEGVPTGVVVVRRENKVVRGDRAKPVIVERKEVRKGDDKATTLGDIKKIEGPRHRIELRVGAGAGAKPLPELPGKPGRDGVGAGQDRSEDRRIEELERTLKKLIGEVDSLKKDRAKEDRPR